MRKTNAAFIVTVSALLIAMFALDLVPPSHTNPDVATYYPSSYSILNQTVYISGSLSDMQSDDGIYMIFQSSNESACMVELAGTSNIHNWTQLTWTVDSAWTTSNVSVTIQLFNYTLGDYHVTGDGFLSYISSATPDTDETRNQTITTKPEDFRDSQGNWKMMIIGTKTEISQFDLKVDLVELTVDYINAPPVASFTESAETVYTDEAITFNASDSHDPDGTIVSYSWDFGDATNATGLVVDHSYSDNGIYTVTLTVTDDDGASNAASANKTVLNRSPVASFTESAETVYTGETIEFNASSSYDQDGLVVDYSWNFGGGNTASGMLVNHSFADNGTYTVTLTVTDDDGASDTANATKSVLNRSPVASFSESAETAYTNDPIAFNASDSYDQDGMIISYFWDFGDGANVTGVEVSHFYSNDGIFAVTLTVTDDDDATGTANATKTILNRAPNASFTHSPESPIALEIVTFNATESTDLDGTIANYTWDFGDGNVTITNDEAITHSYASEGAYAVVLNVTDDDGAIGSTSINITVINYPLADFAYAPALPREEETVTFDASTSDPRGGNIASYLWDFGDNSTLSTTNPITTKDYSIPATYTVNLTVTDTEGLSSSTTKSVTVASALPIASFTYSPDYPAIEQNIEFNASESYDPNGNIVSYVWNFGDGNVTSTTNPIIFHKYLASGNHTVTLVVTDNDGLTDTISKSITIREPPSANFDYAPTILYIGDTVTFNASMSNAGNATIVSYLWDFGDGSPQTNEIDPITTHVYSSAGNFSVALTITDEGELTSTTSKTVTVQQAPIAAFVYAPASPEAYAEVTFNASESYDPNGNIVSYVWNFGDGNISTVTTPTITHFYVLSGNYTIVLIVSDNNGYTDSTSKTITVLARPPTASFTYSPTSPVAGEEATFNASASFDLDGAIVNYHWDFGDGNSTSTSNPLTNYSYATHGTFNITLTVTDSNGLTDSTSTMVTAIDYPSPSFAVSPEPIDVNSASTFDASVSIPNGGTIVSYLWDFGDNTALNVTDPIATHFYTLTGNYTVTLETTDSEGLSANTTRVVQVISRPVAVFTYSPTDAFVGDTVTFNASDSYDTDGYIVEYSWNFGDGTPIANTTDPVTSHIFSVGGNLTVTLTATDNSGYTNSTTVPMSINKSPAACFTHSPDTPLIGETVTFDASGSSAVRRPIANYTWNFKDGNITTTTNIIITHTYLTEGSYDVELVATDLEGYNDTFIRTIVIRNYPVADFVVVPEYPIKNETTTFDASITDPKGGTVTLYMWDFGDSTQQNVTTAITTHTYMAIGEYNATLTVTDNENLTDTITKTIKVRAYPTSDFSWSPTSPNAKEVVTFDASNSTANSGNITTYSWNWGDGSSTSTTDSPIVQHTYNRGQTYAVVLTVTNSEGLSSSLERTIVVQKLPPNASFTYTPEITLVNETVTFNAYNSRDPDGWIENYTWNFGDGNITSMRTWIVNHTYPFLGNYSVTLTVRDNDGLTGTISIVLSIVTYPTSDFSWSPTTPESSKIASFDGSNSTANSGIIVDYTWNFSDGNITSTTDPIMEHTYNVYGTYNVTLTVTNSGGLSANTTKTVVVVGSAPEADFIWDPPYPIENQDVTFDASLSQPNGGSIVVYEWSFGDGSPPQFRFNTPVIIYQYSNSGDYQVTLKVTDNEGQNATKSETISIGGTPTPPTTSFTWSPSSPFIGMNIMFDASLSEPNGGTITSFIWDFGDGNTSTTTSPTTEHVYALPGNYTVTLNVTDSENLWSTLQKQISILPPSGPTADFTWTPYWPNPNQTVTFDGSASILGWNGTHAPPIKEYIWNFGDGNITVTTNPTTTHTYGIEGNFTITLTVVDVNDANDTALNSIRVSIHPEFPWDVNGDGYVGIDDIFIVATHFSLTPEDPEWDPACDINGDGYVGIDDIFDVALHFGEEPP